jgi:hypothetical protein
MSLSGVDKIIKHVEDQFICGPVPLSDKRIAQKNVTHLLGLLLVNGITRFRVDYNFPGPIDEILNKYVGTGDILSAQDELIDAGFIDQARL